MRKICLFYLFISILSFSALAENSSENRDFWFKQGQTSLQSALQTQPNTSRAKNIILFVGDGNGVASVTATRIFAGQALGNSGEEHQLAYEKFPHVALSKTYNTNQQTPDSAGTMTAIITGVKTKAGVLSLGQSVKRGACNNINQARLPTFLEQMEAAGKATGIISTARITHATPAATYSHSPERNWETDTNIPEKYRDNCPDIAQQLVDFDFGNGIEVILGGGRSNFFSEDQTDPEYSDQKGRRENGNLIKQWQQKHPEGHYVWNQQQFDTLSQIPNSAGPVLGLFEPSHMQFEADRKADQAGEPSLSEMVSLAITRLQPEKNGFFLMVESGRIDHAHHYGNAHRALVDGKAFAEAVQTALDKTNTEDTLIIVTADHSHVLTMAGYPTRGNPILGKVISNNDNGNPKQQAELAEDGMPYTTLGYHNGGDHQHQAGRRDLQAIDTQARDFFQEYAIPTTAETHGGEDVAIYAIGPWAHLIQGVQEQNYIYHVMHHAAQHKPPSFWSKTCKIKAFRFLLPNSTCQN